LLALTLAKIAIEEDILATTESMDQHFIGWKPFIQYLMQFISISETIELTGLSEEVIRKLANYL
jgi:hypothetical protein